MGIRLKVGYIIHTLFHYVPQKGYGTYIAKYEHKGTSLYDKDNNES